MPFNILKALIDVVPDADLQAGVLLQLSCQCSQQAGFPTPWWPQQEGQPPLSKKIIA